MVAEVTEKDAYFQLNIHMQNKTIAYIRCREVKRNKNNLHLN